MSAWKPGDVAMVRSVSFAGEPNPEVRRIYGEFPEGENGFWYEGNGGFVRAKNVASIRPLVVIDPESAEDRERLAGAAAAHPRDLQAALREFAKPTPPKPDEPTGLTARVRDTKNAEWWRWSCDAHTFEPWARVGAVHLDMSDMQTSRWSDIEAVEVLSAGWSE